MLQRRGASTVNKSANWEEIILQCLADQSYILAVAVFRALHSETTIEVAEINKVSPPSVDLLMQFHETIRSFSVDTRQATVHK